MPSNHLTLCHPLLFLPSILPNMRVFSNESVCCIRWPKCWSFSFSISPSNEYSGLISFRMDWVDLRRNGVATMVNKTVRNAVLGCSLKKTKNKQTKKKNRVITVQFQGKPFNIIVIQVYAPTSNAEKPKLNGSMNTYKTF